MGRRDAYLGGAARPEGRGAELPVYLYRGASRPDRDHRVVSDYLSVRANADVVHAGVYQVE